MLKKIIGLVVACVLALFGGGSVAMPAAGAPKPSATVKGSAAKGTAATTAGKSKVAAQPKAKAKAKAKAAKVNAAKAKAKAAARAKSEAAAKAKANKAKAAKAKAVKAKAAAKARENYVSQSGPRVAAAEKAAAVARSRRAQAKKVAAQAPAQAAAAARAAAAAQARAAAIPNTKRFAKAKKKAVAAARAAVRASAKANERIKTSAAAAKKAKAVARAKALAADEARAIYVALAGPRAEFAAKEAATAGSRAAAAVKAAAQARAQAVASARAAYAAQVRAAALLKTTAPSKAKKKTAAAARAALGTLAEANARAATSGERAGRATALARDLAVAAAEAKAAAGPNPSWAPSDTLIFNNPRGSKKQKFALIRQLNKAIDATPAGGQIRMAQYLFDIGSVAKRLIAAHRRGVSVQLLIDDGERSKHLRKVRKVLGKNKKARSFVATCSHSCMSSGTSVIHAKFYLFSVAGKSRYVSLISSANPYTGNVYRSWNNNHTIAGDGTIYNSLLKYFTDMLPDKKDPNYYRVTTSGKYTIYFYPQKARRAEDIVWLNALNQTSCKTTAPGYGSNGRTLIRVANWGWTNARLDIAKRLWKLHDSGCKVQVMVNKGRTSKRVLRVLLKRSPKYGQIPVYNAWRDYNHNDIASLYVHHKVLTINGLMGGQNVKTTWTGSQNFTALGTTANNDLVLRIADPRVTDAYNRNFAYIRRGYTHRMRFVPLVTRRPDPR